MTNLPTQEQEQSQEGGLALGSNQEQKRNLLQKTWDWIIDEKSIISRILPNSIQVWLEKKKTAYAKKSLTDIISSISLYTVSGTFILWLLFSKYWPAFDFFSFSFAIGLLGFYASMFGIAVTVHISFQQKVQLDAIYIATDKLTLATKELHEVSKRTQNITNSIKNDKITKENVGNLFQTTLGRIMPKDISIKIWRTATPFESDQTARSYTPIDEDYAIQVLMSGISKLEPKIKTAFQEIDPRNDTFNDSDDIPIHVFFHQKKLASVLKTPINLPIGISNKKYLIIDQNGGWNNLGSKSIYPGFLLRIYDGGKTYVCICAEDYRGIWAVVDYLHRELPISKNESKTSANFQQLLADSNDFIIAVSGNGPAKGMESQPPSPDWFAFGNNEGVWETKDGWRGDVIEKSKNDSRVFEYWNENTNPQTLLKKSSSTSTP